MQYQGDSKFCYYFQSSFSTNELYYKKLVPDMDEIRYNKLKASDINLFFLDFFSSNIFNKDEATQFFWLHPFRLRQVQMLLYLFILYIKNR